VRTCALPIMCSRPHIGRSRKSFHNSDTNETKLATQQKNSAAATTSDLTEGGLVVTPIENDRRAQALRMLAAMPPAKGKNNLLITHKPNILDAFGKDWFDVKEGEASVFLPTADGKALLIARIQAADVAKALR